MSETDTLENMLDQMSAARPYADIDDGVFERLKYPERTLNVTLPIHHDDGRVEATGRGVAITADHAFEYFERDLTEATVAIQGFGNVGRIAARLLDQRGATIVAVSDITGGTYNGNGLDIAALERHVERTGGVTEFGGGEAIGNDDLLRLDVDVLCPAALENAITADVAEELRAELVLEAANGPTTVAADEVLRERDIPVVPDILTNAGGIIVSYLEWVQNSQQYSWDLEQVNADLERRISTAFEDTLEAFAERETPDLRTAAYAVALERVGDAHEVRGLFP